MSIHPYVQARLRALSRQEDAVGVLLGTTEDGITNITGFRRASPSILRQVAIDAGPSLAGFYRVQTAGTDALSPDDEELWQELLPGPHGLFLLLRWTASGVRANAWMRADGGEPTATSLALDGSVVTPEAPLPISTEAEVRPRKLGRLSLAVLAVIALAAATAAALRFLPGKPLPLNPPAALTLQLHSEDGELTAIWDQQGASGSPLKSASLTIRDGNREQVRDLTKTYTPRGRVTVRPKASDIVFTLRVQYADGPPLSRAATYLGFLPAPEAVPQPAPVLPPPEEPVLKPAEEAELIQLRIRNKELEEAVTVLRKHMVPQKK